MTQPTPPLTANGPIFIVGYIHTGTSLLKSICLLYTSRCV